MLETSFLEDIQVETVPANKSVRFINWLIDIIFLWVLILAFFIVLGIVVPNLLQGISDKDPVSTLLFYVIGFGIFLAYYTVIEGLTNGKTIGKLVTKTRAVKEDGSAINYKDAFKRSLSRIVPFEIFSALGERPWHDKWTDTIVIKENRD